MQQVRIALLGTQVVIKNAFLQRCQRIDVLHIGSAAGHRRDDALDAGLIQRGQGEHVGRDAGASSRNQIGRYYDFPSTAQGPCQRSQVRLIEQHAHIGAQTDLTHALDQANRQKRMAAQFEEIVVAADLLDVQYVGPDLRECH